MTSGFSVSEGPNFKIPRQKAYKSCVKINVSPNALLWAAWRGEKSKGWKGDLFGLSKSQTINKCK